MLQIILGQSLATITPLKYVEQIGHSAKADLVLGQSRTGPLEPSFKYGEQEVEAIQAVVVEEVQEVLLGLMLKPP